MFSFEQKAGVIRSDADAHALAPLLQLRLGGGDDVLLGESELFCRTFSGADAPKVFMPRISPVVPM